MIVRCRLHLVIGIACLLLAVSGCSDRFLAGPLHYDESEALTKDLKGKIEPGGQDPAPGQGPEGTGQALRRKSQEDHGPRRHGGLAHRRRCPARELPARRRGRQRQDQAKRQAPTKHQIAGRLRRSTAGTACTATASRAPATARPRRSFIPIPRDYRKGLFKFTSTPNGARPSPRRPAADGQERAPRHVDAGVRGADVRRRDRAGRRLRDLPEHPRRDRAVADRRRRRSPTRTIRRPSRRTSPRAWRRASSTSGRRPRRQVVNPPIARTPSSPESILRGRELFLGKTQGEARVRRLPRLAGPGRRPQLRQPGRLQPRGLRRQSQRAGRPDQGPRRQDPGALGPEARRVGQPAAAGQPQPRRLQGGPAAARHLLADRQGDHRGPDARALPDDRPEADLGPGQLRAGPALSARAAQGRPAPAMPVADGDVATARRSGQSTRPSPVRSRPERSSPAYSARFDDGRFAGSVRPLAPEPDAR